MIDFDFIPPDFHSERGRRGAVRLRASLVGVMIAGMSVWAVANQHELSQAGAMLETASQQKQDLELLSARHESMEQEHAELSERVERLRMLKSRASLVLVLADLSRRMPDGVFCTEVRVTCPSVAAFARREIDPLPVENSTRRETAVPESAASAASAAAAAGLPRQYDVDPIVSDDVTRIVLTGMATDTAQAIAFVRNLEQSPLIDEVQLKQRGQATVAGRRGQTFEVTADIANQAQVGS